MHVCIQSTYALMDVLHTYVPYTPRQDASNNSTNVPIGPLCKKCSRAPRRAPHGHTKSTLYSTLHPPALAINMLNLAAVRSVLHPVLAWPAIMRSKRAKVRSA